MLGKLLVSGLKIHKSNMKNLKILQKFSLNNTWPRHHSSSNSMKVTVLGAGGNLGKATSLMLKQSPFIDELCLYDSRQLEGFAQDLNFIDTKCWVTTYSGNNKMQEALTKSNIVVVLGVQQQSDTYSYSDLLEKNSVIVKDMAKSIVKYAPKSLIAIGAEPINSTVPMFSEVMKKHGHYNPYSIFGITTIDQVRANKFVAEILGLDPECVVVPMIGGHTEKTIVPVLSQATPCSELTNKELEDVTSSIRSAQDNLVKAGVTDSYLSTAFAVARFVVSLVKAVRGQSDIVECAFVKSGAHGQLKYMVTPLLLGPGGITKNLGVPELSDYEQCLFDTAIPILAEDIKKGEFIGGCPMDVVDGKLKEKPLCDPCDPKAAQCPPDHCEMQSLVEKN